MTIAWITNTTPNGSIPSRWPTTWPERHHRYALRRKALLNESYTDAEIKALGLFRAKDGSGNIIHETRRVMRDLAFIARVNASAMSAGLSLATRADSRDADPAVSALEAEVLAAGMAVWRRSMVPQRADHWAWTCAGLGDLDLEVSTDPQGRGLLIAHKPEHVWRYYDPQGIRLEQVVVEYDYDDAPDSRTAEAARHRYKRTLTATEVRTEVDGVVTSVDEHSLGVVPWVHVPFMTVDGPSFSASSIDGYMDIVAIVDSAMTQMSVIGSRFAAPWLAVLGALLDSGEDGARLGKVLNMPAGSDVKWLEPTLTGVASFVEQAKFARDSMVSSTPEYLFADAGASASGTALSYRAGQFLAQVEPVAERFRAGLATGVGMALALEAGQPFDEVQNPYTVEGANPLPEDRAAAFALVQAHVDAGLLKAADAVSRLQSLGTVPKGVPPETYAAEAQAEQVQRNAEVVTLANRMGRDEQPEPDDDADDDLEDVREEAREALSLLDAGDLDAVRESLREIAG